MAEQNIEERISNFLQSEDSPNVQPEPPQASKRQAKAQEIVEPEELSGIDPDDSGADEILSDPDDRQPDSDSGDDADDDDAEEISITTLQELADHYGIDIADMYALTFPVTGPDGRPVNVPIGELKDSYQASQLVKAEREKLINKHREFEKATVEKTQQFEQQIFTAAKMIESIERYALGEINSPEIQGLRHSDPAEYAAIIAEHDQRVKAVERMKQDLGSEFHKFQEGQKAEKDAKKAELLKQSLQILPKLIPEWTNEKIVQQDVKMINEFGLKSGLSEQELKDIADPRAIAIMRKAALYDRQQSSKPEVKKRVVSIGKKTLKSGKSMSKTERSMDAKQKAFQQFKTSGGSDLRQAAALIEQNFLGEL